MHEKATNNLIIADIQLKCKHKVYIFLFGIFLTLLPGNLKFNIVVVNKIKKHFQREI